MRFVKGFIVGGVVIGALAFAAGYNHGRGVPILSNPFAEAGFADRVRDAGEEVRDATDRLLDQTLGN